MICSEMEVPGLLIFMIRYLATAAPVKPICIAATGQVFGHGLFIPLLVPNVGDYCRVKIKHEHKKTGKIFVIAGTLESISCGEAKKKIKELGGKTAELVLKLTSYVVVGLEPGSKNEKAKEPGVKILNEKEFLNLIES